MIHIKTLKTMGIIGLILSGISFLCLIGFDDPTEYEAGIGWGLIAVYYLIALSIVCIVQAKKHYKQD